MFIILILVSYYFKIILNYVANIFLIQSMIFIVGSVEKCKGVF